MPRNLTSGMLAAITSSSFTPALFVMITFDSGPVYIWSGLGSLTTSAVTGTSVTFTGLGRLLAVEQVEEGTTADARGIVIHLSGIDTTLLSDVLTEQNLGLPVVVWLAAMSGGAPVVSPPIIFAGATDQPEIKIGPDTSTISLNVETLLAILDNPCDRRLNPQDQAMNWPGDVGLQFVYQIIDISFIWGNVGKGAAAASKGGNAI